MNPLEQQTQQIPVPQTAPRQSPTILAKIALVLGIAGVSLTGISLLLIASGMGYVFLSLMFGSIDAVYIPIIIGIVLGIGAITLALIDRSAKKTASRATKSLVLGSIAVTVGIVAFGAMFAMKAILFTDLGEAANSRPIAKQLRANAEIYNENKGTAAKPAYPTLQQVLNDEAAGARIDSESAHLVHEGNASSVTKERPVAYEGCTEGVWVHYWDRKVVTLKAGNPEKC